MAKRSSDVKESGTLPKRIDTEEALSNLDRVDRLTIPEVVEDLVGWVGLGLTAMAGGVQETRFVHSWKEGTTPRRSASLRAAWRAAYIISVSYGSEAAQAWFIGQKREFNFQPPISILQKNTDKARSDVVRSAVRFATT